MTTHVRSCTYIL